jgi:hypothetical protein
VVCRWSDGSGSARHVRSGQNLPSLSVIAELSLLLLLKFGLLLSFSCSSLACGFYLCAEMPEYCGYGGKFVWPSGDPPEDWKVK